MDKPMLNLLMIMIICVILALIASCGIGYHTPKPEAPPAGPKGDDGGSCSVTVTDAGALIQCEDGTTALVTNGSNGSDGLDGQDGVDGADGAPGLNALVEVIDPCGQESSYDEVLFRFSDGNLYAVYASGNKIHLTELVPGTYITTDGTDCTFTVTEDLEVE